MNLFRLCIIILAIWSTTASAQVQTEISSFVHSIKIKNTTDTTRVSQWVTPLKVQLPFLHGQVGIQSAFMTAHQTGTPNELAWGALDTQINGRWQIGQRVLLSLHTSLPTGKRSLNAADAQVIGTLARNDLNFPVRAFGQGFDLGGTLSVAKHQGHWSLSAGIRAIHKGGYTPTAGSANYKPGDEITSMIGVDYSYNNWIFQLNTAGTFYKVDRQNGAIAFRNGKQILLHAGIFYWGHIINLKAELIEIARLKNRNVANNGYLLSEARDSNGNDLRARIEASLTPVRSFTLFAQGSAKYLTANAHPPGTAFYQGDAHLFEGGGGFSLSIGQTQLALRATYLTGKTSDNTAKLSAFNIRTALTFGL